MAATDPIYRLTRILVAIAGMMSACVAFSQSQAELLLRNAHIIVGDGSELAGADVLISDGVILGVGSFPEDAAIRVVDLSGKTMMPALIDGHAHLGYEAYSGWGAEYYGQENLRANLQQYAYYGFSAVFSAGSDPDGLALEFQQDQNQEPQRFAQFLFAAGMAPPGQGPNNQFLAETARVEQATEMTILRGLASAEQARSRVREVAELGIEFIKIWVDDRGGTQLKLAPDIYRAVADEANLLGLKVFVHQQTAPDMVDLIQSGVHGFLHGRIGNDFSDDVAMLAANEDVFVVPNLGLGELRREAIAADDFLAPVLNEQAANRLGENSLRSLTPMRNPVLERELRDGLARYLAAGGQLVLGTDAGAVPDHPFGYSGHRELEIYVRLGVPPMVALTAATGNAARYLGLQDQGLVRTGYQADLLILDADPIQDIRNTRLINRVLLDGDELDRESLLADVTGR